MTRILRMRPPRIAAGLLVFSMILWHLSPAGTVLHFPYHLLGTVSLVIGCWVMVWAWLIFRKAKTAICPTVTPSTFITKGPYGATRNPMYLGMLLMLFGAGFMMGSLPAFTAPVLFFILMDRVFITHEEGAMLECFGDDYREYQQRVRRWI